MGFFNPVIPTQNFVQSRNPIFILTGILSIPNFAPILLYNPESRVSNKGNPGTRETYWGPSYINGLEDTWVGCNAGYQKRIGS